MSVAASVTGDRVKEVVLAGGAEVGEEKVRKGRCEVEAISVATLWRRGEGVGDCVPLIEDREAELELELMWKWNG